MAPVWTREICHSAYENCIDECRVDTRIKTTAGKTMFNMMTFHMFTSTIKTSIAFLNDFNLSAAYSCWGHLNVFPLLVVRSSTHSSLHDNVCKFSSAHTNLLEVLKFFGIITSLVLVVESMVANLRIVCFSKSDHEGHPQRTLVLGPRLERKTQTQLKTNLKLTVLNNTKLHHFWVQIVSWAPRHARKTFIVLAPDPEVFKASQLDDLEHFRNQWHLSKDINARGTRDMKV